MGFEFVLVFSLTRLAKGESWADVCLKFGYSRDKMGVFFYQFIRHIFTNFYHKISGTSMGLWLGVIDELRGYVWRKVTQLTDAEEREMEDGKVEEMENLLIPFEVFRLFGYLDTTHVKTC